MYVNQINRKYLQKVYCNNFVQLIKRRDGFFKSTEIKSAIKYYHMKKFTIVFVCILASVFGAVGQPPKSMGQSDPEAKKVLDAVSAKFKTFKTVKASFNY